MTTHRYEDWDDLPEPIPTDPYDSPEFGDPVPDWMTWLFSAEPHNLTVTEYVGDGPDAEEREIEVEARPGYPEIRRVLG